MFKPIGLLKEAHTVVVETDTGILFKLDDSTYREATWGFMSQELKDLFNFTDLSWAVINALYPTINYDVLLLKNMDLVHLVLDLDGETVTFYKAGKQLANISLLKVNPDDEIVKEIDTELFKNKLFW